MALGELPTATVKTELVVGLMIVTSFVPRFAT
jgi:hypothetical protein